MSWIRTFVRWVIIVEVLAVLGLLLAGALLDWVEADHGYLESFFSYQIRMLDYIPAWFALTLALMVFNGFWMFRLASIEGFFRTPTNTGRGTWGAQVPINPLRLFAINLVAIPGLILIFLLLRANHW